MEELKQWCPLMNSECRYDCGFMAEGELDVCCAFKIIAEHLVGGSIGIRTYAEEPVCVTTDSYRINGGFHVSCNS